MNPESIEARFKSEDAVWNGPRFHLLLGVSLAIAITIIYVIACLKSGDYVWHPFAHEPLHEIKPSGW